MRVTDGSSPARQLYTCPSRRFAIGTRSILSATRPLDFSLPSATLEAMTPHVTSSRHRRRIRVRHEPPDFPSAQGFGRRAINPIAVPEPGSTHAGDRKKKIAGPSIKRHERNAATNQIPHTEKRLINRPPSLVPRTSYLVPLTSDLCLLSPISSHPLLPLPRSAIIIIGQRRPPNMVLNNHEGGT